MSKLYTFGFAKLIREDIKIFSGISPFHLLVFSHMCWLCDDDDGGYKWYPKYLADTFLSFSTSYQSSYRQIMRLIPALENRKIPLIKTFKPDRKKVKFLLLLPNHKAYLPDDKLFKKVEKRNKSEIFLKQKLQLSTEKNLHPIVSLDDGKSYSSIKEFELATGKEYFRSQEYNQKFKDNPHARHI